jgi:YYY domain-containing protein
MGSLLAWWAVVVVLGFAALPLTFLTLKHLPDKGYAFSKVIALLFMGYVGWLVGHLGFNAAIPFIVLFLLIVVSSLLLSRSYHAMVEFFKARVGYVLVVELLFLAAFLLAGAFKMRTGDITGTEKPMDFAMINGILASGQMPPQDPWLSGGSISYYYFGYFIVAMLVKLTNTVPSVAFNLAVALIWALAAIGSFGLGYALTRRYRYAALSSVSAVVLGNLDYWHRAFQSFALGDLRATYYNFTGDASMAKGLSGFFGFVFSPVAHYWDYFQASRVVKVTATEKLINEFPSFSFFLSDLHPHVMAIPFVLLALALVFSLMKAPLPSLEAFGGRRPWQVAQMVLLAVVFGSLGFLNSWDFPTLTLLLVLALGLQTLWSAPQVDAKDRWKVLGLVLGPVVAGSFLLFLPFYIKFQSQAKGIGLVKDRTDLYYLFILFGFFLVVLIPTLTGRAFTALTEKVGRAKTRKSELLECVVCGREGEGKKFCGHCGGEVALTADAEVTPIPSESFRNFLRSIGSWMTDASFPGKGWVIILAVGVLLAVLNLGKLNMSVIVAGLSLAFLAILSFGAKNDSKEMVFGSLLAFVAALLLVGCEVLYVKDHFSDGDLYRMNSVFKFHYQVWLLLSIAIAPLLKWLLEVQYPAWQVWQRVTWIVLALFVLIGAAMYPALTVYERARNVSNRTLDGLAGYRMSNPGDTEAAEWVKKNVVPVKGKTPVVLESWGGSYSTFARIATQSGVPTILGWDFHEAQWRGSWDKAAIRGGQVDDTVLKRRGDVDTIYSTTDVALAKDLLRKYGVEYVVVGMLERDGTPHKPGYPAEGLAKFGMMGPLVFNQSGTVIYKIDPNR